MQYVFTVAWLFLSISDQHTYELSTIEWGDFGQQQVLINYAALFIFANFYSDFDILVLS